MNPLWCLGMHERHAHASEKAQGHEALLGILKSVVLKGERQPRKDLLSIHEIEAVRGQVGVALRFVPGELHRQTIYTDRIRVK